MKNTIVILVLWILTLTSLSQIKNKGIPYIQNYGRKDYDAGTQNFSILQDKRGIMYFGNRRGILEFDGTNWRTIPVKNKSIVRSLLTDTSGVIYVGAKNDFGYLKPDKKGELKYISLVEKLPEKYRNFKDISYLLKIKDKVYYISVNKYIFIFSNDSIKIYESKSLIRQAYKVFNELYIKEKDIGISKLTKNGFKLIPNGAKFAKESIRAMLPFGKDILVITRTKGMFLYNGKKFSQYKTPVDKFIDKQVVKAIKLRSGAYALGLYSKGLLIIDTIGNPVQLLNTKKGLQNNQVLSLHEDNYENLWLGLGNGISYTLTGDPISLFNEKYDLTNKSYSSIIYKNKLYVGTALGIYYKEWYDFENHLSESTFKKVLIQKPLQAWKLDTIQGELLCSSSEGIYKVEDSVAINILDERTIWNITELKSNPNLLIAGHKKGLMLLEKKDNNWRLKNVIKGIDYSCRYLEIDNDENIWISDDTKGIYKLVLNDSKTKVEVKIYGQKQGLPYDINNHILKTNKSIIVGTEKGIYKYDNKNNRFVEYEELNKIIGRRVEISDLSQDQFGNIWFKEKIREKNNATQITYELGLLKKQNGTYKYIKDIFNKLRNNIFHFSIFNNENIIIGSEKGFFHYQSSIQNEISLTYNALIRKIEFVSNDSLIFNGSFHDTSGRVLNMQTEDNILSFPFEYNNLRFTFSATYYEENDKIRYKYFLEGNDDNWSQWKSKNFKEYSNLEPGKYKFYIKAKNIYNRESEVAVYQFVVKPPWYRTVWAYVMYIIIVGLSIWGIVQLSMRRLRKQNENLERIVKERTAQIQKKNEELNTKNVEIEEKNKNITSSINYAKRIQEAMLPMVDSIKNSLKNSFILFKPRDIVSGDFYWFAEKEGKTIITAVDCTGHGVPGAFMSMIGSEILTTIVNKKIYDAGEILSLKNLYVRKALKQDATDNQDGMDMALCVIDKEKKQVFFSGAKNPLVYIQNGELLQIKGDKQSIGGYQFLKNGFKKHIISYAEHETLFYIFSDGFQDQFGGPKQRKFMIKRLKKMLLDNHKKPMNVQKNILNNAVEEWMVSTEQTDDILLIGFALGPN